MRASAQNVLRERYGFRCGYCGVHENDAGSKLTIDHFRPRNAGGSDEPDNLVYCCHACNEFKSDCWQPDSELRILHPLLDAVGEHVQALDDGTLKGVTETGKFHIEWLRLNRPELVAYRLERRHRESEREEREALKKQLAESTRNVKRLRSAIDRLTRRPGRR